MLHQTYTPLGNFPIYQSVFLFLMPLVQILVGHQSYWVVIGKGIPMVAVQFNMNKFFQALFPFVYFLLNSLYICFCTNLIPPYGLRGTSIVLIEHLGKIFTLLVHIGFTELTLSFVYLFIYGVNKDSSFCSNL